MDNKREKCSIPVMDAEQNEAVLGRYIEGYDSQKDRESRNGCSVALGIFFLAVGLFVLAVFFASLINPSESSGSLFIILIFSLALMALGGYLLHSILSPWFNPTRVYVYEKGFVVQTVNRKGEEQSRQQILFDDVESISYAKTRRYTNGAYSGTGVEFTVFDQFGKQLLYKRGGYRNKNDEPDKGGWLFFSLEAIDRQWGKIALERMNDQLTQHGELTFKNESGHRILLTKQGIEMDDQSIPWEYLTSKMHDGYLWMNDSRKKKGIFSSSDIKINVNKMPNSRLFLAACQFFVNNQ